VKVIAIQNDCKSVKTGSRNAFVVADNGSSLTIGALLLTLVYIKILVQVTIKGDSC